MSRHKLDATTEYSLFFFASRRGPTLPQAGFYFKWQSTWPFLIIIVGTVCNNERSKWHPTSPGHDVQFTCFATAELSRRARGQSQLNCILSKDCLEGGKRTPQHQAYFMRTDSRTRYFLWKLVNLGLELTDLFSLYYWFYKSLSSPIIWNLTLHSVGWLIVPRTRVALDLCSVTNSLESEGSLFLTELDALFKS